MKLRPNAHGSTTLADGCEHGQGELNGRHGPERLALVSRGGMDFSQRAIRGNFFDREFFTGPGQFKGPAHCVRLRFKTFPIQIFTVFPVNVKMHMRTFGVFDHAALQ